MIELYFKEKITKIEFKGYLYFHYVFFFFFCYDQVDLGVIEQVKNII